MMGRHGYGSVYKVPLLWNFPASGTGLVKGPKGRCLDAANAGGVDGGVPHMWDCDASNANQQWSYLPLTGQIQHNPPNGKCLTRTSATDDVDMLFYACDEDDETQRWAMDAECVSETGRHPDDPACMSVCPPEDHDTWKHCKTCVNHKTATTRSSQMGSCTSCDEGFVMAPHHNQRFSTMYDGCDGCVGPGLFAGYCQKMAPGHAAPCPFISSSSCHDSCALKARRHGPPNSPARPTAFIAT